MHAKLYAAIAGDSVEVIMGSANATDRAWAGRNAEAVARFEGGQPEIDGIAAIVGSAFPITDVHMAASESPKRRPPKGGSSWCGSDWRKREPLYYDGRDRASR